ncbi:General odorant-binding protein 72 [Pseudolycoriella hygida]|uniref:General odorant-binding protein 72 n=1 Tax=Pseudolycoriella hygida TaxID=35572 RepID=A0A9Q0RY68_9DIPT|nr:General odorant-binding protein 72 [Pseudolycoriella hygida]
MAKRHGIWMALLLYISVVECGVTIEQMEKSSQMVRSVCQPKLKITDEMANGIREGKFPNDKVLKCYVHCILEMTGLMKKNKLNYDAAIKQMDMLLPDELLEDNKFAIGTCKDSANGVKDACEAG